MLGATRGGKRYTPRLVSRFIQIPSYSGTGALVCRRPNLNRVWKEWLPSTPRIKSLDLPLESGRTLAPSTDSQHRSQHRLLVKPYLDKLVLHVGAANSNQKKDKETREKTKRGRKRGRREDEREDEREDGREERKRSKTLTASQPTIAAHTHSQPTIHIQHHPGCFGFSVGRLVGQCR